MRISAVLTATLAFALSAGLIWAGGKKKSSAQPITICSVNSDCDDGTFCNGHETCMPGANGANARGCVAAAFTQCAGMACDETMDQCTSTCPDNDKDGHADASCAGGDDCDDNDARRFPGNPEVCDAHDEDCNPCTVSAGNGSFDGDADGDGHTAGSCTNAMPASFNAALCGPTRRKLMLNGETAVVGGDDCDDSRVSVAPGAQICDPSTANKVKICWPDRIGGQNNEGWTYEECAEGLTCSSQPNGTGVCR